LYFCAVKPAKKIITMATTIKTQELGAARKRPASAPYQEPKRLSKFALWRRENPNGIIEYVDWRAANK